MSSSLPWLGMDDDEHEQQLELLMAFKRHKESTQQSVQQHMAEVQWMVKVKNVVMGETIESKVKSGVSLGDALKFSFAAMRQQNAVICVLSLCGLVMQICEAEILYSKNNETSPILEGMKAFVTLSSLLAAMFLGFWYRLYYDQKRLVNTYLEGDTFWNTNVAFWFIFELAIQLFHAPPGVHFFVQSYALDTNTNTWRTVAYSSDEIICTLMFARFYVLFRGIMQTSGLQDEKAQAVATLYQEQIEGFFIVKKFVFMQPIFFLTTLVAVLTFAFTYWIMVFERVTNEDLSSTVACLWLVVTTMTKTGYGDVYPRSAFGRITIVFVCAAAVFMITCATISMFSFVQPTNRQLKVIQALEKTAARRKVSNSAASTVQRIWRKWRRMVYDVNNPSRVVQDFPEVAQELRTFRATRKETGNLPVEGLDTIRTEVLGFRSEFQDVSEAFDVRLKKVDETIQTISKKFERYVSVIDASMTDIDDKLKELERRRAF